MDETERVHTVAQWYRRWAEDDYPEESRQPLLATADLFDGIADAGSEGLGDVWDRALAVADALGIGARDEAVQP